MSISSRSIGAKVSVSKPSSCLLRALDLDRHDQHQILDADAIFAGLVIAGLVGEDHAGLERLVAAGLAAADRRDALRPFVHREEAADAMAGAVGVIEPGRPQELAREAVELRAARAVREARAGERDMALEHAGEAVPHLGRRRADRRPCG